MITRDATLKYRNLLGHYKENNAVRLRFDLTKFEVVLCKVGNPK